MESKVTRCLAILLLSSRYSVCWAFSFGQPRANAFHHSVAPPRRTHAVGPLFTASKTTRSRTSIDGFGKGDGFLNDGKGHINPELAQRIFKWEREHRLPNFSDQFSTREGLRWIQDLATTMSKPTSNSASHEDLIQEGVMALMQAMTVFEEEARPSQSFEAFTKERIQQAMEDYLAKSNLASSTNSRKSALSVESTVEISDPLEVHYSNQDEWEVREGLVLDDGKKVKRDELVEDFLDENLQYEGEDQMWVHQQQVAGSLRDMIPSEEDDDTALMSDDADREELSLDDMALRDMILYNVDEFLSTTLDDMEAQVIQLRFGLDSEAPRTQKEVAFDLGISISKVRKIQKQAIEKLRNSYSKNYADSEEDQFYHEDSV